MKNVRFHDKLKFLIHQSIIECYKLVANFPQNELYGASSQLRRSAVSIMLNYTEVYGRIKPK